MEIASIDLSKNGDVSKLGWAVGVQLMDGIKQIAMKMEQEQRIVFYMALLKTPVCCMYASVGAEATRAILDSCREEADKAEAARRKAQH